jgi:hypothetical protein
VIRATRFTRGHPPGRDLTRRRPPSCHSGAGGLRAQAVLLALTLFCVLAVTVGPAPQARADGPGTGTPWVVTVGDSYISGEAGCWARSSNDSSSYADALGSTAYYDNAGGTDETIDRCHRSRSA